jgi:type I restriction enzyme S subunit
MTKLPDGWEIKRLDEIADIVMGQSPPGSSYNEYGEGQPFFQGKTEFGDVHPTVRKYTTAGTKFAKAGDILMSVRAPVGPTNIADIDCVIGRGLAAIRAKNIVSQDYLRWSLKHLEIYIQSKGTGTTFDAITGATLRGTWVALPPIGEQRKIVELLEEHLARLDAALADVKQAKAKAGQFRKSLLQSIFEGQYSASSDTWEHRTIGDFAEVKGGKRLPKGTKWSDEPTFHPYIRATDIKFGNIKTEDLVHVPDSVWKSISRYIVEENDVVITIAGTIGEIAVVPSGLAGANLTENAAKLVFDHNYVMPSYLSMYLQSPSVQQELKELSRATTQAKLALYRIATVEIPVPTLNEQQKLMKLIDEKLTYLTSSLNQIAAIELQASSLSRSLLQAAFTGQLTKEVANV